MIIVSSCDKYTATNLYTFVSSLNNSGYNGKKVMVVYECNNSTKEYLTSNGWIIYQKDLDNLQVVTKRFKDISDVLSDYDATEQVLSVDCRDVYFHKNPELYGSSDLYIGIDGDYPLIDNEWATKEMLEMYPSQYNKIKSNHHLCAGVVLGKNENITSLFKDTFDYTFESKIYDKFNTGRKSTVDQMALNILAYGKYKYQVTKGDYVINLSCTAWDTKKEYFIYHQYDRVDNFWSKVNSNIQKNIL
tara:strand:- start:2950 stop:3687 length:738 start_codon:yes stop_codon:yes gene_type:complete